MERPSTFNATYQRQRPALLLANGSIYAGFGSFCDHARESLAGLAAGVDGGIAGAISFEPAQRPAGDDNKDFFLSSIWMSGYGPAADDAGQHPVRNRELGSGTYDGVTNIQESVVKISNTLTTAAGHVYSRYQAILDQKDVGFRLGRGAGAARSAGIDAASGGGGGQGRNMYLMNEDNLGGYSPTQNNVLGTYSIGRCWCGQSYFVDPTDGLGRVVTSGDRNAMVWRVQTSPTAALTRVQCLSQRAVTQDPGFFTTISSNGNANPIIWALSRPAEHRPQADYVCLHSIRTLAEAT